MNVSEYSLKWSNHGSSLAAASCNLLEDGALVDVTLVAEGQQLQAHKLMLASSSTYFKHIFMNNPCQHPVVILRDVRALDLQYLLLFIYQGHVKLPHFSIASFMELAKALEIVGLAPDLPSSVQFISLACECKFRIASLIMMARLSIDSVGRNYLQRSSPVRKRKRCVEDDTAHDCPSSPLQLKTEIQDMLEVLLDTDDAQDSKLVTDDCTTSASYVNLVPKQPSVQQQSNHQEPQQKQKSGQHHMDQPRHKQPQQNQAAGEGDAAGPGRPILPKPPEDTLLLGQNLRLRIPSSHQPEFPLDPSCAGVPYPCPFCDKAYMSWGFRRRHIKVCHSTPAQLSCKWCAGSLPSTALWQVHYPLLPSGRYTTLYCPLAGTLLSTALWQAHVQQEHQLPAAAAQNGILILEEALMVLQFAAPTRLRSIMQLLSPSTGTKDLENPKGNQTKDLEDLKREPAIQIKDRKDPKKQANHTKEMKDSDGSDNTSDLSSTRMKEANGEVVPMDGKGLSVSYVSESEKSSVNHPEKNDIDQQSAARGRWSQAPRPSMSLLRRPAYDDIHGFVERVEDVLLSESSWSTSDSECSGCLHLSKESVADPLLQGHCPPPGVTEQTPLPNNKPHAAPTLSSPNKPHAAPTLLSPNRAEVSLSTAVGPVQVWHYQGTGQPEPYRQCQPYKAGVALYRWHPNQPGRLVVAHTDARITLYGEGGSPSKSHWYPGSALDCSESAVGCVLGLEWAVCSPDFLLLGYTGGQLWLLDAAQLCVVTEFCPPASATLACFAWLPHAPGVFVSGDRDKGILRVWTAGKSTPMLSYTLKDTGFHELCGAGDTAPQRGYYAFF
ncbi:hypothetical protein HAZT_HAZT008476 [Hyalella azteca]|uniref:BTB domain-containing protein n=1 Tax=Hyalella azteca TaxID=294128 RepID=A0A6A0HDC8_HYAAZ|nr:hypothetical protein HAZT_HAZT008476 [Hyalella azteca]